MDRSVKPLTHSRVWSSQPPLPPAEEDRGVSSANRVHKSGKRILPARAIAGWFTAFVLVGAALQVKGQDYRQLATVRDGSGGISTNVVTLGGDDYQHASASGQPGGIQISSNSPWVNYAGFLQAADIKRPLLDTDGDGVVDELDTDNDADLLGDGEEVEGSSFDPITPTLVNDPDSDDDGVIDGNEAAAGTDPTDGSAFLHLTGIRREGSHVVVRWVARGGKAYRVMSAREAHGYPTNVEGTATAVGGVAPWYETTCEFTNAPDSAGMKSFGVQVIP